MRNINKFIIFSLILFFGCLILANNVLGQDTTKTYVDNDKNPAWYDSNHVKTIQEGIDNITNTGIVYIWDSIYFIENVSINKPVSLVGNGTSTTILEWNDSSEGTEFQSIFFIESDYINISGLHFNNSAPTQTERHQIFNDNHVNGNFTNIFDCLFTNGTLTVIYFETTNGNNLTIHDNEFYDTHSSIEIHSYTDITISNNTINNTETGIYLDTNCVNGEISYNDVTNTTGGGQINIFASSYFLLHHNTLMFGDWTGFVLEDFTHNCTIYTNTIIGFNETDCYGMSLYDNLDNTIYNNYFLNDDNVYDGTGSNTWSIEKTLGTNIIGGEYLGGNYWSDYTGEDNTGDGLGDTNLPYDNSGEIVTGGDYLPLTVANLFIPPVRLTEHLTDPSKVLLAGLVSFFLILGLLAYTMKTIKEKTFKFETFITLFFAVVVITVILSFI